MSESIDVVAVVYEDGDVRVTLEGVRVNVETRLHPDDVLGAARWELACWGVLAADRRSVREWRMCRHGEHHGPLGKAAASLVALVIAVREGGAQ